jgi:hypothetical protein
LLHLFRMKCSIRSEYQMLCRQGRYSCTIFCQQWRVLTFRKSTWTQNQGKLNLCAPLSLEFKCLDFLFFLVCGSILHTMSSIYVEVLLRHEVISVELLCTRQVGGPLNESVPWIKFCACAACIRAKSAYMNNEQAGPVVVCYASMNSNEEAHERQWLEKVKFI